MIIGTALRPTIEADELNDIINHDFSEASQDRLKFTEEEEENLTQEEKEKRQAEFDNQQPKTYDYLDEEKLYDYLFTLADIWCPACDEMEYKEFFKVLKFKLKYPVKDNAKAYDLLN